MTVTINKTDGTVLATVADGTVDTSSTNIALIGRLYRNYGELINENMVKLLENFANTSSPSSPIIGQLWYDKNAETIKVYRDTGFVPLARITSSSAEPNSPGTADLWYDLTDEQLKYYSGSQWIVISPGYTAAQSRTGAFAENIQDVTTANHIAVVIRQQTTPIAIFSKDPEYTPLSAITGFTTIKPGLNISAELDFQGDATNADLLDGINSTQFLRSDENDTTSGTLGVQNDTGLTVGVDDDIKISVDSTTGKITKVTAGNMQFIMGTDLAVVINDSEQLLLQDGNVATPKLSWINDPDTGFYKPSVSNVAIGIDGTIRSYWNTTGFGVNGNMGATGTLDVTGNVNLQSSLTVAGNITVNGSYITLGNAATDNVIVNADTIDIPNDLTFTTGDVAFDGFVTMDAGADINGDLAVTGNIIVTGNTSITGAPNITGNTTITGTLTVAPTDGNDFKVDSLARVLINRTNPATGYDNEGDLSLGSNTILSLPRDNAIYARNVPKHVVTFNGTLAGLQILRSHHVYTVTRTTTGTYAITLYDDDGDPVPLASAYPTIVGSVNGSGAGGTVGYNGTISGGATSITIYTYDSASGGLADFSRVSVAIWDGAN